MWCKTFVVLSYFLLGLFASLITSAQQKWEIANDYSIEFSGTKAEGTFRGLVGEILFDPSNLEASKFDVSVAVNTISTGNKTKDKHAKGDSWFDAIPFPSILFQSKSITRLGEQFEVVGDLELKGIRKEVAISFSFSEDEGQGVFKGDMTVNRQEFGIEGNLFGFVVGDDFEIILKVPVQAVEQ